MAGVAWVPDPAGMATTKTKKAGGTDRWHPDTVADGHFILLPKALIKGTGRLKLKPHHVWLILALQLEQFRDHPSRHYWAELASWAKVTNSTMRRWASELKKMGLLNVKHRHGPRDGEQRTPGFRNDRNEFYMNHAADAVLRVHKEIEEEKAARKRKRGEGEP